MSRNIELKARCADLGRAEAACRRLGARWRWTRRQRDVYFGVPEGRLKLRCDDEGEATLVRYDRPDRPQARESHYELSPVEDAPATLRELAARFGIRARVEKTRTVYQLDHIRIHLDEVEGLGTFVELEAVMDGRHDDAATQQRLAELRAALGIREEDLLASSYVDYVIGRADG